MQVRVSWKSGDFNGEFEYFSKFSRINAKGIKEEMKDEFRKKYGYSMKYFEIYDYYRINNYITIN